MSIIYILTNPAFEGYVKIGKTTNLKQRLRSLDNTSIPLPFRCTYAARVTNVDAAEKLLHDAFGDRRVRDNREFFEIDRRVGCNFARNDQESGLDHGLGSHPRLGVLFDNRVQDGVRYLVRHLVGVTLGNRLRGED